MYDCGEEAIFRACLDLKNEMCFNYVLDGKQKQKNYGGNTQNVKNMIQWLPAILQNTNFIRRSADTSLSFLLFQDGIFNIDTQTFSKKFG